MIVKLTTENKRISKLKKISFIIVLIIFGFGSICQNIIPFFEYVYITILISSLLFWIIMYLFTKGYVFVGELNIYDDKFQINHNDVNNNILNNNLTAIVFTIIAESGKGWALFGSSGAKNKVEIYTRGQKEVFNFYLANVKEIQKLKIKHLKKNNPNIKIIER